MTVFVGGLSESIDNSISNLLRNIDLLNVSSIVPPSSSTIFTLFDPTTGTTSQFEGFGFGSYDINGVPQSGTVTAFQQRYSSTIIVTVTSLSFPVAALRSVIFARDAVGLSDLLFSGRDEIIGTALGDILAGYGGSDTISGGAGNDYLIGGDGDDVLGGGSGADTLEGNAGSNALIGGSGDDLYVVSSANDIVLENLDEGIDGVLTSVSFYLGNNVEALQLASAAGAAFGVGNASANTIFGNQFTNLLIAGAGNDFVAAGAGNDSVFGEDGADLLLGEAGVDYLVGGLGGDTLDGGADADALYGEDGNDLLVGGTDFVTDILVGGAGDDFLDGASGLADYDLLDGGSDNDFYRVDTGDDLTFEAPGGGTDTVIADVKVANAGVYLYANLENLILEGTTAFGVGNELANVMTGSSSANWLLGGAGNDTLNGKGGGDVLFGQGGADTFIFEKGQASDVIGDFQAGADKIQLTGYGLTSFAQVQALFVQVGDTGAIRLPEGDLIVMQNFTMSTLTSADFMLG